MSEQIKTAVILAAGMGTRLGNYNNGKPKGLLKIETLPIIHESINKLRKAKIQNIVLVTGFKDELYDEYFKKNSLDIHIVKNLEYETSSTLSSLSKVRYIIKEDFLLLESDIIYDSWCIEKLILNNAPNTILVSKVTGSGDEVYVECKKNLLKKMSKDINKIETEIYGEFVGINKISLQLFHEMMSFFDSSKMNKTLTYEEDALVNCADYIDIECLKLEKFLWSEIDSLEHLKRAKKIYKEII
tara:strand:- start:1951 stop:2679 length:729 start_codon:yes stop_codon:yes gene_type:complete